MTSWQVDDALKTDDWLEEARALQDAPLGQAVLFALLRFLT